ncbi:MAG: AtpZ/AtpI family protein [Deltaproteobacteria bacterium]|nr:AtpZ/AtpI family protein [Deltaproteobacteria bacterium]
MKSAYMPMVHAASIGLAMVISIFGSLFIGRYLDGKFATGNKLTFLFLIVGIFAGFWNLYKLIKTGFSDEKTIITCIKNEPHRKRPPPIKN